MISKYYCIACDVCGNADYYQGDEKTANRQAKSNGWIIKENGKAHFDAECYKKFNTLKNSK